MKIKKFFESIFQINTSGYKINNLNKVENLTFGKLCELINMGVIHTTYDDVDIIERLEDTIEECDLYNTKIDFSETHESGFYSPLFSEDILDEIPAGEYDIDYSIIIHNGHVISLLLCYDERSIIQGFDNEFLNICYRSTGNSYYSTIIDFRNKKIKSS